VHPDVAFATTQSQKEGVTNHFSGVQTREAKRASGLAGELTAFETGGWIRGVLCRKFRRSRRSPGRSQRSRATSRSDSSLTVPMVRRTTSLDAGGTRCRLSAARRRAKSSPLLRRRRGQRVGRVAGERLSTGCNRETAREGRYEFPVEGTDR